MTIDDMKQGVSKIRNPVIAHMFRELRLIEQWGSGVRRMFDEAREQGLPEPGIEEIGMRMRFTVPLKEPMALQAHKEHVTPQVTPQVERLLHAVKGEMNRETLQSALRLQDRKSFRALYLTPALADGLLEMTIPEKPNSRLQKYRLTETGKAMLSVKRGNGGKG